VGGIGIAFWNVAGIRGKDRDFWEKFKRMGCSNLLRNMGGRKEKG